jgi:hypothetical protein
MGVKDWLFGKKKGKNQVNICLPDESFVLAEVRSKDGVELHLMIINKSGITIRTAVDQIPVQGRATQGVRIINLGKKNDCIGSVCKVTRDEQVDEESTTATAEEKPELVITINDFEGFDDDWSEIMRDYDGEAEEALIDWLEEHCISGDGDFYYYYYFEDFNVQLGYSSYDI